MFDTLLEYHLVRSSLVVLFKPYHHRPSTGCLLTLRGFNPMTRSTRIPQSAEEITAQWFTEALRSTGAIGKAVVKSFRMKPIGVEQGFTGSLFRFTLDYIDREQTDPASLIAKFAPPDPEQREALKESNIREVHFYRELVAGHSLPTADCFYSDMDLETGASILLLQDLTGMRTVEFLDGCTVQDAERTVRALAQIHAIWWDHPELETLPWLSSLEELPYQEWWAQYPQAIQFLLPDYRIPDTFFEVGQRFSANMSAIMDRLEGAPFTLIHRDIHVDNILFGDDSSAQPVLLVDWQAAGRGLGISDVAYFLISSVPIQHRRQAEVTLVHTYHDFLVESGIQNYGFGQCWSDYVFSAVAKLFISVAATIVVDNSSDYRRAWRTADLQRLVAFIEDHSVYEIL